eukprot:15273564-Ditylum_brightwellii.AAC.1
MEIKTSPAVDGVCSNATKHSKEMAKQTALNHAKKSRGKLVLAHVNAKKKDKSSYGNAGKIAIDTGGNDNDTKMAQFQTDKGKMIERGVSFVGIYGNTGKDVIPYLGRTHCATKDNEGH